jgi:hypothetical protein
MQREYDEYVPSQSMMREIRRSNDASPAHVTLFVGTWCGHTLRDAPRVLRVAADISPQPIVECIGIGDPVATDPIAKKEGITGIPVIIGSSRSHSRVRASSTDLEQPEAFFVKLMRH